MPGSWEILELRRNRVLVVTISPPDFKVSMNWARMLRNLELPPLSFTMDVKGPPYGHARNIGVKVALDEGFGHLFFLDADVIAPPNTVTQLLAAGRDFIGALYYKRSPPYKPAAGVTVWQGQEMAEGDLPPFNFGDVIPIDFLPAGATLISRRCLEAVLAKYPRPFEWQGDIDTPGYNISEDYNFSLKAADCGFRPWLATGLVCQHELVVAATARGLEAL